VGDESTAVLHGQLERASAGKRQAAPRRTPLSGLAGAAPGRTVAQDVDEIAARIGIDAASLVGVVEA
jgi:hypothetical protein